MAFLASGANQHGLAEGDDMLVAHPFFRHVCCSVKSKPRHGASFCLLFLWIGVNFLSSDRRGLHLSAASEARGR